MRRFKYSDNGKLVRDSVPERVESEGGSIVWRTLDDAEYAKALLEKVTEEAREVAESKNREELILEIADLHDVLGALCVHEKITPEEVAEAQRTKLEVRGGFGRRVFAETLTVPDDSRLSKYCEASPSEYPEIPVEESE